MRMRKRSVGALLIATFSLVVFGGSSVFAAWEGLSYFEGASTQTWPPSRNLSDPQTPEGQYSKRGSVMPNPYPHWEPGFGAVGRQALDTQDGSTDKEKFFNLLKDKNQNGTAWEKMGSALIVHQMLERSWGTGGRVIPNEDWDELEARLVLNDNLIMEFANREARDNTAGALVPRAGSSVYDTYDAFDYDIGVSISAWSLRFYDESQSPRKEVYALEIWCANPLGALSGLPDFEPDPEEYELTPTASIDKTVVEPDDSVQVTNTVTNSGIDPSDETIWRLTRMVYGPGVTLSVDDKAGRDSQFDPCNNNSFIATGRSECETVPGQEITNAVFNPGAPRTFDPVFQYNVPDDTPVGTKICFTASVSRPTQEASPVWRHSTLQCIVVGKKPKLQVWGGDVRSGGKIETSTSTITSLSSTYGSWGEYGALSKEANRGFASGSGLNNGSSGSTQSTWSNLTFANTGGGAGCSFGCYNFSLSSAGLVSQFVAQASAPPVVADLNSLTSGTYRAHDVTLSGTTIASGKTIVLVATGTVTIDGSIAYEDIEYTDIRAIPQVIIKAPSINIRNAATQVDAWLLAVSDSGSGTLNTCSDVGIAANLTADICNNQLVINGPVVADTVYLRRTAGSNSQPTERGTPAETFNLRADAYLWAHAYGSGSSSVQTVYTKELSPRF